jgi:hypothetical protein
MATLEDIDRKLDLLLAALRPPSPVPLDSVHQVQQQAMQLLKEGKREESKALLKAYSQRERRKKDGNP